MTQGISRQGRQVRDAGRNTLPTIMAGLLLLVAAAGLFGCYGTGDSDIATPGGISGATPLATGTVNVVTFFSDSEVSEEPTGATVVVDSALTSIVSAGSLDLPAGPHTISAQLAGHDAEPVSVTVTPSETSDVYVELTPAELIGYGGQQGKIDANPARFQLSYKQVLTPDIEAAIVQAVKEGALIGHATVSDVIAASLHARMLSWKARSACSGPKKVLDSLDSEVTLGAWCWAADDQESSESLKNSEWVPQGITSSHDASADGLYEGLHVVLVSWYAPTDNNAGKKGARISFFEYPDAYADTHYKHVLLATPFVSNGKLNLQKVPVHAGGIAWYGNLLYVADTREGFRIFDMRRIYKVHETSASDPLGRHSPDNGKLYGADYDFVLLEVGRTTQPHPVCPKKDTPRDFPCNCQVALEVSDDLCFSSVSLDRSTNPPALVTSEYRYEDQMQASKVGMRIVRWNLGTSTELLEMDAGGQITSAALFLTPTKQVQGAFMKGNEFYLSTTQQTKDGKGKFYYEKDGDGRNPGTTTWARGAEDLSYWPSMNRLWSVTERPGSRMVFWVYANEMQGN